MVPLSVHEPRRWSRKSSAEDGRGFGDGSEATARGMQLRVEAARFVGDA